YREPKQVLGQFKFKGPLQPGVPIGESIMDIYQVADNQTDESIGEVLERIEANMWLADSYYFQGARELAMERLRTSLADYDQYAEIFKVYANGVELRDKLVGRLERMKAAGELLQESMRISRNEELAVAA